MIGLLDGTGRTAPRRDGAPNGECSDHGVLRALVVFEHRATVSPLRVLRPGFRHCCCLIGQELTWILCDPLKTRIELTPVAGLAEVDIVRAFAGERRVILRGIVAPNESLRPIRLRTMSCVEVVKRVLNVDLPWALTPFQLYRGLLGLPSSEERFELAAGLHSALDDELE